MRSLLIPGFILLLVNIGISSAQSLSTSDYIAITFMITGAIITTIIIFMIIHHYIKHKEETASDPRVALLRKHFRDYLDKGYTKKQVIDAAVKQGWPPAMVESAMNSL